MAIPVRSSTAWARLLLGVQYAELDVFKCKYRNENRTARFQASFAEANYARASQAGDKRARVPAGYAE